MPWSLDASSRKCKERDKPMHKQQEVKVHVLMRYTGSRLDHVSMEHMGGKARNQTFSQSALVGNQSSQARAKQ